MENHYQERWWDLYKAAILETNPGKPEDHINAAEEAIVKRSSLNGEVSRDERVALDDSRTGLRVLKQEHREGLRRGQRSYMPHKHDGIGS